MALRLIWLDDLEKMHSNWFRTVHLIAANDIRRDDVLHAQRKNTHMDAYTTTAKQITSEAIPLMNSNDENFNVSALSLSLFYV